jgi:hypothetical protein
VTFPAPALYLAALALTLAIEAPLYALGFAVVHGSRWQHGGTTGLRVNLVSHPIAFLIAFPVLAPLLGTMAALVAVEIGVVYLEALLIWRRRESNPMEAVALSAIANVASLAVGLALIH